MNPKCRQEKYTYIVPYVHNGVIPNYLLHSFKLLVLETL